MERFDFVSVMACLTQHISEDLYQNQTDLLDTLFADFINDSDFEFDNGLVNKWLRGKAKLSPQISLYYRKPKHQYALCATIERTVLPIMADPVMAAQELYELLLQDSSVSPQKKEEFDENEDAASLITQLLCFAMSRNFEKREQPEKYLKAPGGLSPVIRDMIIDNGIPKPCRWFRGRTRELEQLHDLLLSHDKVFLHGIPGIGKSEAAKAYAQQYRKDYTNILYIPCVDSLRQAIIDVDFVADLPSDTEDQRFRKHNRFLRSLREDTLIIIDNFNTVEDELLDVICNYRCRVLFTTRNRFEHRTGLELSELEKGFLFQMVECFYSDAQKNREIVDGILEAVHCHTFAVELTARLMESGFLKPERLLEKLQAEKTTMDADDTIRTAKDGKTGRATYHDHIHTLFELFRLSRKAQEILRNMTLMPLTGISARLFGRWLGLRNLNAVNDLIDIGMIQPGCCRIISLHPMIREVVMAEYPPSVTTCETLIEGVLTVCWNHGRDVTFHRDMIQVIENIRSDAAKDDLSRYVRFLEGVYPYFDRYDYKNGKEQVIDEITTILQDDTMGDEVDRAWLLDYRASQEDDPEKAIKLALEAEELIGKKIGKDSAPVAASVHSRLGALYLRTGMLQLARSSYDEGMSILEKYDLTTGHEGVLQIVSYTQFMGKLKEYDLGLKRLGKIEKVFQKKMLDATMEYAAVQECIAMLHMMEGRIQDGFSHYKQSLAIWEQEYADKPEMIDAKKVEIQKNCEQMGYYLGARLNGII